MKKFIAVTAIALLAAAFAYSGVSNSHSVGLKADNKPVMVAGGVPDTTVPA